MVSMISSRHTSTVSKRQSIRKILYTYISTLKGLNMAYAQALSTINDITLLLDPNKQASISIFAVLSALTVGLAFLTVSCTSSLV